MSGARAPRALVVGLTGGIGSGKSSVAERFAALGVPVIDADHLAREVVEPGQPALEAIAAAFGAEIVGADGNLDRAALRARVFVDATERERLEAIIHPVVRERLREALERLRAPYVVVEIQLLVESGQRDVVDRVLVVEAAEETRIERASARDGTGRSDVERIIAAQATPEQRRAAADDVIDNNAGLEVLDASVMTLHERYLALAAAREPPAEQVSDLPGNARG